MIQIPTSKRPLKTSTVASQPSNSSATTSISNRKSSSNSAPSASQQQTRTSNLSNLRPAIHSEDFQAQKIINLQAENAELKKINQDLVCSKLNLQQELASITDLYNSLLPSTTIAESSSKTKPQVFTLQKQILLESQIFQLKRQLKVYKDELAEKEWFIFYSKEQLDDVKSKLSNVSTSLSSAKPSSTATTTASSTTSLTSSSNNKSGKGSSARAEGTAATNDDLKSINECVKRIEGISKLIKRGERDRIEKAPPSDLFFSFSSDFLKSNRDKAKKRTTIADIASGSLEHVNLVHISRLEKTLSDLYTSLLSLESCLSTCWEPHFIKPLFEDRMSAEVDGIFPTAMEKLVASLNSITTLLPLLPTAPLPGLEEVKRSREVDGGGRREENVLIGPPGLPRVMDLVDVVVQASPIPLSEARKQKLVACATTLLRCISDNQDRMRNEIKVLNNELEFHRQVYSKYTKSVGDAIEQAKCKVIIKEQEEKEKQIKIEAIYKSIQNLEWKEDVVSEFLEGLETDLHGLLLSFPK